MTLVPACALAFLGTTVKVGVRDAETNKPLDRAFVVLREFAEVGKFHGSRSYCVRAAVADANAPRLALRLPSPGSDALVQARGLEGFAYRPGYCVARVGDARAAAGHKRLSLGMAAPKELDPSGDTLFAMRRAAQAPEERLAYLEDVAQGLTCHEARWGAGSKEAMGRLADAMLAEANALARSKYERHLAGRVAARLAMARELAPIGDEMRYATPVVAGAPTGFARDFIVGPANARATWRDGSRTVIAATNAPMAAAAPAPPRVIQYTPPPPARLAIHCRHGAPSACDLDERDAEGATALHSYAWAGKVDEVRVLLEAGADPNATKGPGGDTAMDIVVRQVLYNYSNADTAAQVLDLLAANGRTTIRPALKDDLATDPSTWRLVTNPSARERLLQRRDALMRLPASTPGQASGCEELDRWREVRLGPPRLR